MIILKISLLIFKIHIMFIQNFYDYLKYKIYMVFVNSEILIEILYGNVKKLNIKIL